MTSTLQQDDGGQALANRAGYTRQDLRRREIVNHAISVQESSNTMSAIEYLKSHDIDAAVIARVLLEPARRRATAHH